MNLPLAPFEHYMLADDRPGWPMTGWLRLALSGRVDPDALRGALTAAAAVHPLMRSVVAHDARGRLRWAPGPDAVRVEELPRGEQPAFGASLDPRRERPWRVWLSPSEDGCDLWLEFHHAVCDGRGIWTFVEDVFRCWGGADAPTRGDERWDARANCGRAAGVWARGTQAVWMMRRAAAYFFGRPTPLVAQPLTDAAEPAAHCICNASLGDATLLRAAAAGLGATVNDVLLSGLFDVLARRHALGGASGRPRLRLFVPMNLRGADSPAVANQVGMVHLDYLPPPEVDRAALLRRVREQMQVNRQWKLARTFLEVVGAACRCTGSPRILLQSGRCPATMVLSNLGELSQPTDAKASGPAVPRVTRVELYPPIRPDMPANLAALTFGGEVVLGLRYHASALSRAAAERLLQDFRTAVWQFFA